MMKGMRRNHVRILTIGALLVMAGSSLVQTACVSAYKKSVGGDTEQVFNRIFLTDYNTAWQATLDSLKSNRLDISNRESGFIQTRWTDNTAQRNFTDSFGAAKAYLKAQYRLRLTLNKGFYNGLPSVKVAVLKEQLVQFDVLEGWNAIITDSVDENTLLYRIGRIIFIRMKIAQLEEEKTRRELEAAGF